MFYPKNSAIISIYLEKQKLHKQQSEKA